MNEIRAAILARVSSAEQGRDEKVSIPNQIAACRAEIRRRCWIEYGDPDTGEPFIDICSGAILDRPKLGKILAAAAQGRIQAVVALRTDRVARDTLELLLLERELRDQYRIQLVLVEFPVDLGDPQGRAAFQMQGVWAELERSLIRKRTLDGKRGSVAQGGWTGGEPPYGFQVVHTITGRHTDKRLEHAPDEVEAIRAMVELLLAEALPEPQTLSRIADWLNAHDHQPRKAPRWTSSMVRWTLTRRTLLGELVFAKAQGGRNERKQRNGKQRTHHASGQHGEPIVIEIPAILDPATFEAVQAQLAETGLNGRADDMVYLLSGRLTMPCGRVAHGWYRKDRDRRLYRCSGVRQGACNCHQLDADAAEASVWDEITAALSDPERVARMVQEWQDEQPADIDTGLLDRRIAKVRAALERAYVAGLSSGLDTDALKAATASLQQDLKVLEREKGSAEAAKLEAGELRRRAAGLRELAARMDTMAARDRQQFLRLLDVRVTADPSGKLLITGYVPFFGPTEAWDGSRRGARSPRSCHS
jgi:DNA invertase Pin-like site-specific DNA recombinase